jgi:hypothetical protein
MAEKPLVMGRPEQLEGSGGFRTEYTIRVEDARFETKEDGDRCFLNWYGVDHDTGEELARPEGFTMGSGWEPREDGIWCEHPDGYESFSRSTVVGQIYYRAQKMGLVEGWKRKHGGTPDPRDPRCFIGGIFKMGPEEYKNTAGEKKTRVIPVKFLGWADEAKATKATPALKTPEAPAAPAKKAKEKAGSNGKAALAKLQELAGAHDTFQHWQAAAIMVPGVGSDKDLMPKLTDQAFYNELREAALAASE